MTIFAGEIYHSFQNACRVIQRSGSEKSFGMLSQFVCSHSTSKYLTAWIWSSKKYYSVKPLELPVFAYRHKERVQLFGDVFWFTNISRSVRECRSTKKALPSTRKLFGEQRKLFGAQRKLFGAQRKKLFGAQRKLFGAQRINKERSLKLSKSSEHRERLSDFFKRGFEKESVLLIPKTPLKAMDENCDTITDQTLCIEGGNNKPVL